MNAPRKPLIGIPLDWEETGTFSKRPYYALRTHYFEAIEKAGGIGLGLPLSMHAIPEQIALCDGFLLPGGTYPFTADWYQKTPDNLPQTPSPRIAYDVALVKAIQQARKPVLGICAGMQVMAGVNGALFYRSVQKELPTDVDHLNAKPAEEVAHPITITEGSLLHRLMGSTHSEVNTAHSEAIACTTDAFSVTALSKDRVIEAIEWRDYPFGLGVQWHPEFFTEKENPHFNLFKGLIAACQ